MELIQVEKSFGNVVNHLADLEGIEGNIFSVSVLNFIDEEAMRVLKKQNKILLLGTVCFLSLWVKFNQLVDKWRRIVNFFIDDELELVLEVWILRFYGFSEELFMSANVLEDGRWLRLIRVNNFVVLGEVGSEWLLISHLLF